LNCKFIRQHATVVNSFYKTLSVCYKRDTYRSTKHDKTSIVEFCIDFAWSTVQSTVTHQSRNVVDSNCAAITLVFTVAKNESLCLKSRDDMSDFHNVQALKITVM